MPGIHDMAFHVPRTYLSIEELANRRNIEYAKLNKGLGLEAMSLADVHEDAATMAANAVRKLIENNKLDPRGIGRIYVGSESATDGSKPIASYVLAMLSDYFGGTFGPEAFIHTDVVDMTFACIAAVDALHNTLDWVRADPSRVGIVVATDNAKYELGSTGEYTQGAGAVAMLVKDDPDIIEFDTSVGVATVGVHDFFKPIRRIPQRELVGAIMGPQNGSFKPVTIPNIISSNEKYVDVFQDYPVYDGQYSNECYSSRMKEAYDHYVAQNEQHTLDSWGRVVFHLPYAFHGKRFFTVIFAEAHSADEQLKAEVDQLEPVMNGSSYLKRVAKSPMYRKYVADKIEKGQRASSLIGNLYTGSIFMSLMSMMEADYDDGVELFDTTVGFCSYGSGSKAKVFSGRIREGWRRKVSQFGLMKILAGRTHISFEDYEKLHGYMLTESLLEPTNEFYLDNVNLTGPLYGKKTYKFEENVAVHA